MTTRRSFLAAAAVAATAAALRPLPALALTVPPPLLLRRAIPSTGEQIPVIGMGTSGSFEVDAAGREPLKEVLRRFVAGGGSVIDTSPNYSNAEDVLGDLMAELGLRSFLPAGATAVGSTFDPLLDTGPDSACGPIAGKAMTVLISYMLHNMFRHFQIFHYLLYNFKYTARSVCMRGVLLHHYRTSCCQCRSGVASCC